MLRFLVVAAMVGASAVAAQTTTTNPLTIQLSAEPTRTSYGFGDAAACGKELAFQVAYSGTYQLCSNMKVWGTQGDCGNDPASGDKTFQVASDMSFKVVPGDLPGFSSADGGVSCGQAGVEVVHQLCASIKYTTYQCGLTGSDQTLTAPAFEVTWDSLAPAAPVITETVALDGAARLTFTVASDVWDVNAQVREQGAADWSAATASVSTTDNTIRITRLLNGTTYEVRLFAQDEAGNTSVPSELAVVTPIRTVGFWGVFREQGGTEQGGCAAAGGAPLLLLAWAAVRALERRRSEP